MWRKGGWTILMIDFDFSYVFHHFPEILPYLGETILIMIISLVFSVLLGLLVAAAKLSKHRFWRIVGYGYTNLLRCTPAVVLLFIVYYGLPQLLNGLGLNLNEIYKGIFVIITLSLLFAAAIAEVMRSAYESLDKGQYEAGVSIGLSSMQTFIRIILPQCFVIALPNLGNALIALFHEGAIAFTIGFIDIMGKANLIVSNHYGAHAKEIYIGLALLYWVISILIGRCIALLELKLKEKTLAKTV